MWFENVVLGVIIVKLTIHRPTFIIDSQMFDLPFQLSMFTYTSFVMLHVLCNATLNDVNKCICDDQHLNNI